MTLLITFLLFCLAGCCIIKWFSFMIQSGGMLDVLFGYQRMLNSLYNGNIYQQLFGKAIGDCQMCMCFWFSVIWYWFFYGFCKFHLNIWVTDFVFTHFAIAFLNITAFLLFQPICGMLCFFTLTKLFKK